MKLVIILGPHAVGKMTVGQKLAEFTGLKLFHNHMTIELVRNFFSPHQSDEGKRLNKLFRREIFESVAKSDLPGLIFTYMYAFDQPSEKAYIDSVIKIFEEQGAETLVVELCADFETRIERNKTENRLLNKPSKRDIPKSEALFRNIEANHRMNSNEDEKLFEAYLKIDNTNLPPEDIARLIMQKMALQEIYNKE